MISNLPTLALGLLVPMVLVFAAGFVVRGIKKSLRNPDQEYTGAMGSAAMEAMMAEARRQRAMLQEKDEGESGDEGTDSPD